MASWFDKLTTAGYALPEIAPRHADGVWGFPSPRAEGGRSADRLGPQLSGIVSTYPVILTVIGAFTHQQWGRDAVRRVLRGLAVSLLSFAAFFLVVGLALPTAGVEGSFGLASVPAIAISGLLLRLSRARAAR